MSRLENVFSGESAASRIAYAYSEAILIVQNTKEKPSFFTGIEDLIQHKAVNTSGIVPEVTIIPSTSDIAASYRNLATKYSRVSLYTSSRNLLRLIPLLYQLSSEQTPTVIHVAAESSESLGTSPFGDYSDLMAVRDTGVAMLGSHTIQDCYNLSVVAYLSSLKSKVPFIHFFDSQHLSHKNAKIDQLTDDTLAGLIELTAEPTTEVEPTNEESEPVSESAEVATPFKNYAVSRGGANQKDVLESVTKIMTSLEVTFQKLYSPVTYAGNTDAELAIVALGASGSVVEEALIKLSAQEKFGLVKIYLFRPWAEADFLELIPKNVKKIAVLEQSSDSSNIWGPLFLDTTTCFQSTQWASTSPHIISGHYGGPLRNFAPEMVNDLIDTLQSNDSENHFQLGSKEQNGFKKESQLEVQQPGWENVPENAAELPYLKLLSHLFGERLSVVNASRSASVWSPTSALPTNNPEFGFGVIVADIQKRARLAEKIATLLKDNSISISEELHIALSKWVLQRNDPTESKNVSESLSLLLEAEHNKHAILEEVYKYQQSHQLVKPARWLIGSDEWAFDLGNSGVHHVISSRENVNMLVVDTTPYTERDRWVAEKRKKDIGLYAMNYGKVYVASVAVYSSYTQVLHALMEAEAFDGPSVVLAYMPINSEEGEKGRNPITVLKETKLAVDTGYWPLYRWNPSLEAKGLESFILDSEKIKADLQKFLSRENQLNILANAKPEVAKSLESSIEHEIRERHASLVKDAKSAFSKLLNGLNGPPLLILVASDGGNAATLAKRLDRNAKCRGMNSRILSMDEFPAEDLGLETNVIFIISTAGQGEFPTNGRDFWKVLSTTDLALKDTNFSVFGLGDSHYWPRPEDHIYYNKPAKDVNNRLFELGAVRFAPLGLGDDQDADGFETGYKEWEPKLWEALGVDIIEDW
ncbi:Sulfite reductase [NADPH] subunit beta [Basidiobolus ranarum]|uniref:Sulfite reductase [NADPH] subunit beta n=1 Tax=Basidiobolus ranarum TaxID=34480 RepID=A0ABR2WI04_9FUNG